MTAEHSDTPQGRTEDGAPPSGTAERDLLDGLEVDDRRPERPVLLDGEGNPIETWRENHPYDRRIRRKEYERTKRLLQIELLKMQRWVKDTGQRIVVVCEGRDAAGKGGTIQRFTERLNPRGARVVALEKPTEREAGQWYFQRYVAHLPGRGEIVFFDRSWYNRAGVERVMGFCTDEEYRKLLDQTPMFEQLLTDDGILLVKFWFSVSRAEQRTRFAIRQVDPVRRWKLSPMDLASLDLWDEYTQAKVEMFRATDTPHAPWTVVKNNDKRRGRLEAMRSLLDRCDYPAKDHGALGKPDPLIVGAADTLLEAGEEPAVLSPTPLAGPGNGPGSHPGT
ncbi:MULTISPECIES: polyphosphate kinase 2 [unclassified Streptomyces]|uniref:polyphosphate kinase 2 n=1 Tax=Streptomyces sp. WAC 01420 TaxID=2203203 RepID=UPI00026DEFB0|nr:putative RNA polymerase sigma factor [Streptomyces sp. WAC 01438]AZM58344.1 polyphosphate kinase 2 [Streptomyces sp. WAC 01438]RSM88853.1 polyphosphate kinase 2 [Streptomyces sp. WAC 01420]